MKIRQATAADYAVIWSLLEPVFKAGDTYAINTDINRQEALSFWHSGHDVFVVQDENTVLGTYYVGANKGGGGAHVCNCGFVTADIARGNGVARAMLEHALETAKTAGFRAMQFNFVASSNTRAIAIWERYGFDIVGRLPDAFCHPQQGYVDALVMYKKLILDRACP